MELYTLLFGRSKSKMKPIMVDSYKKCEKYCFARQNVIGFHRIEKAQPGAKQWKQKTCSVAGGWIGKNGFNLHT